MTFYQFLIANKVNPALFAKNCLLEHQRFDCDNDEDDHKDLIDMVLNKPAYDWINSAFDWGISLQRGINWAKLSTKWCELISNNLKIQHGFPSFKGL